MAATARWNPRGGIRWTDRRRAKPGVTRVRHVVSGRTGTFVRWPVTRPGRQPGYAVIQWDNDNMGRPVEPGTGVVGRVVAYAFDLEEIR